TRRMLAARGIKAVIPQKCDEIASRKTKGSRGGRLSTTSAGMAQNARTAAPLAAQVPTLPRAVRPPHPPADLAPQHAVGDGATPAYCPPLPAANQADSPRHNHGPRIRGRLRGRAETVPRLRACEA